MTNKKRIIISALIIGLFLISMGISYAFFSAKIFGNESESTITGTAAYLELTFADGNSTINGTNLIPGWSATKTFSVTNTGEKTAYYKLRITNIDNHLVSGGLFYSISSEDGGVNVDKRRVPISPRDASLSIAINVGVTHNYTITTYYDSLDFDQSGDLGKSFSYTVGIESVKEKTGVPLYWNNPGENTLLGAIKQNYPKVVVPETIPGKEANASDLSNGYNSYFSMNDNYYITYGNGIEETEDGNFNLTGVGICKLSEQVCKNTLINKYLTAFGGVSGLGTTDGSLRDTKNLSSVVKVTGVTGIRMNFTVGKSLVSNEKILSEINDDYGTSYYFRGNVQNNYVLFADKCWKIVRIDGNGNIRLLLWNNNNNCAESIVDKSQFNENYDNNAYVGYMYGNPSSSVFSTGNLENPGGHDNVNRSTILNNIMDWYDDVFYTDRTTNYTKMLADVIWCGDKKSITYNDINGNGIGTSRTVYNLMNRLINPSLKCQDAGFDGNISRYTAYKATDSNNQKGNGSLKKTEGNTTKYYKVGLITADELLLAGQSDTYNYNYYLFLPGGRFYWTMTPYGFINNNAQLAFMPRHGNFGASSVNNEYDLRPMVALIPSVTLKQDVQGQDGTKEHPFEVYVPETN